ncbi:MAG: TetR family transcriptional regulator [Gallionellales bacterium 35-53-114]|jgi:AcrR family transcriptional regulator|nr:MAG: TetR family transcriptional regulator [Gallionellales bacterium 35-53-114]OYZ63866.1 MAG: TetR family transcriptional regulator [Gallionellales bacterium 24-53-125]OZB09303.1 MAG: TetR family transcriptional regulator [Gallionellales bacterium 39-52-133]HQS59084.1 TetR family transcriptional regulator [Gallionellaceae bacterium]HQS75820.1 TetR family transcriptional regulator [Gallionellaceae bacterium]
MKQSAPEITKKRMSSEDRQSEIIRVAVELAAEKDVGSVTTQDMADAMQLTQGAIFRHFASKDEIWLAVMGWIRERLMGVLGKAASEASNPLDAIQRMFLAHVAFVSKHPAIPRILFSELQHKKDGKMRHLIQELISGYEARIAGLLEDAKKQSLVDDKLDSKSAAVLYIGMIQGLVMQVSIFGGKRSLMQEAEKTFPIFLNGISKRETV